MSDKYGKQGHNHKREQLERIDKKEVMNKRTWIYVQNPKEYGITCDNCQGTNIDWSEFEHMIWCYDCSIDTKGTEGVFSGPIPIGVAGILGMCFDRFDLETKQIIKFEDYIKDGDDENE